MKIHCRLRYFSMDFSQIDKSGLPDLLSSFFGRNGQKPVCALASNEGMRKAPGELIDQGFGAQEFLDAEVVSEEETALAERSRPRHVGRIIDIYT